MHKLNNNSIRMEHHRICQRQLHHLGLHPPIPGEADTADNTFTNGIVWIRRPYDVTGDGYCGIDDIVNVAEHFGTMPGDPNWNPIYDINGDNYVGIDDIVMVAEHFGETDP